MFCESFTHYVDSSQNELLALNSLNFVQLSNVMCVVALQLPSAICACQQVVYYIKVNDTTEETYKTVGSFTHTGSGIVKHNIHDVIFERNHSYIMRVQIESAGETSLSGSYFFSKFVYNYFLCYL